MKTTLTVSLFLIHVLIYGYGKIQTPPSFGPLTEREYSFPSSSYSRSTFIGNLVDFLSGPKATGYRPFLIKLSREGGVKIRYYSAFSQASQDLVVVLPGIGETSSSFRANHMAKMIARKGKNVVIFPNIFTSEFANSVSSTGYIGHIPQDAEDTLKLLSLTLDKLEKTYKNSFKKIYLMGHSLGGLVAAHLHALSQRPEDFDFGVPRFERVLLINPIINLLSSAKTLDRHFFPLKNLELKYWTKISYSILKNCDFDGRSGKQIGKVSSN